MRALLPLLLLALAATGCRRTGTSGSTSVATSDTLIPGTFITSPGDYHGREGRYTRSIKLSLLKSNFVSWTLTTKVIGPREATGNLASSSSWLALSSPTDPWFVYVESPGRLWLCDGHANLYVNFIGSTGDNDYRQLVNSCRLTPAKPLPVPKPVFDRLPETIRRILPAPETPVVKPSI